MGEREAAPDTEYFGPLDRAFATTLRAILEPPQPTTLLFSGGVDSSVLALELRSLPELELLTVGRAGSPDLEAGASAAALLGLDWRGAVLEQRDVDSTVASHGPTLSGAVGPARAVGVAFALALERATHRRVVTAQGVDELFLGYHHFRGLDGPGAQRAEADLRQLAEREWPRALALARSTHHELLAPFLSSEWVTASEQIPIESRLPRTSAKALFRAWAKHRGLPESIAERPKRAMQYGSRVHQMIGGR